MEGSSASSAVNEYNGIFKFVHGKETQKLFLEARRLLASKKFRDAENKFLEARNTSDVAEDASTLDLIVNELKRFEKNQILDGTAVADQIDWAEVEQRVPEVIEEKHEALPQSLFVLNLKPSKDKRCVHVIGRKTLSHLWLDDKIPELFCSQVRADMLLGVMADWRVTESKVKVFYQPITAAEKLGVFKTVVDANGQFSELVFPFPLLKAVTRKEFCSPDEGWDVDPTFDHTLSHGETHIREVTVRVLDRLGLTSHRLYDPACSTGIFLSTLKQAFPSCTTIGQDLSQAMCDVAKSRVDEVHCGNAMQPKIPPGSANVVFIRFLNSEVVTSEAAELLLTSLLPTVAPGGVFITFGHTPVLLTSSKFRMIDGFRLDSCVGVSKDKASIFQYYVMARLK